ncbi:hypothetical protein Prudu_011516 [Prunus dulcis]|uniref:Cyclic nucleotide-binding domain-containing protein n=1 Tax=Prunus dulcis TaxID=3755 RepID=A0A4Y1RAT0_PRUDU|nr:hypothetical protein Prudu_011516 [Prunus dulcis]
MDIYATSIQKSLDKEELGRKIDKKKKKIQNYMAMHGISNDTKQIGENIDGEVDVNSIFSVLNEDEREIMGHDICWEKLKNMGSLTWWDDHQYQGGTEGGHGSVPSSTPIISQAKELQNMNDQALETICTYLKPKTFKENEIVVEAGQPLNAMLIIIAGSMQAYLPIRDAGDAHPSTSFETLDEGMFVGEQLLDWAAKTKTFDDQLFRSKLSDVPKKIREKHCEASFCMETLKKSLDDLIVLFLNIYALKRSCVETTISMELKC